jgi:hypothetical protein
MLADELYLLINKLDGRRRRRLIRMLRRQLRFISRRKVLDELMS